MTRVPGLDALRGLAIAGVFLFHASIVAIFELDRPGLAATLGASFGWIGVDLFFAISGFLITRIALKQHGSAGFYAPFWWRRALRILPAYYLLLVVVLVGWPALSDGTADDGQNEVPAYAYWLFGSNLFMAVAGDHGSKPLSVTWSLAVEAQFYLLWPLVVRQLAAPSLRKAIFGLLAAAFAARVAFLAAGGGELAVFVLLPLRCDGLLAGALAACLLYEGRRPPAAPLLWSGAAASFALLAAGLLSGLTWVYEMPVLISLKYSLVGIFAFCLLSLTVSSRRLARLLSFGALLPMLSRFSYALYLWHYAVLLALAGWLEDRGGIDGNLGLPALVLGAAAMSLGIAWLSWLTVERPALRLKRLVTYGNAD